MRTIAVALAFALAACSDHPAVRAHDYARTFSLEPLQPPELRIWTQDFESGFVRGYLVRPDQITIVSNYLEEPETREINTSSANYLIRMIPELRRVRAERCKLAMDGGSVALEGEDEGGRFTFAADNHQYCEGYNLHILNSVLELASAAAEPGYGTDTYSTPAPSPSSAP